MRKGCEHIQLLQRATVAARQSPAIPVMLNQLINQRTLPARSITTKQLVGWATHLQGASPKGHQLQAQRVGERQQR